MWRVHDIRCKANAVKKKIKYRTKMCEKCGCILNKDEIEVHHVIPVKNGGDNSRINLKALCSECHLEENKKNKEYSNPEILYKNIFKLVQN
jgi:5-methylcytosine-specific restriction endonuclease McrA